VSQYAALPCGCAQEIFIGQKRPTHCECGNLFEKVRPEGAKKPSRWPMKRGRGFAASNAQQAKVRGRSCLICGRDRHEATIDPAHVYPRSRAGCNCADGVVPLCREHHNAYDDPNQALDLLPALIAHGYRAELAHAFLEHGASWREVLEIVTGCEWKPAVCPEREAVAQ
jgi:hypothetical protein